MSLRRQIYKVAIVSILGCISVVRAAEVLGGGATLPAPVYAKWTQAYQKTTGNKIVYQSIGSGSGVAQVIAKSVDFGATDIPLSDTALQKNGLVQFPTLLGGVVPIVNLPNMKEGELRLSGPVLADIFLGKITKWNDPAIVGLNAGRSLPNWAIAVIRRTDSAGTTALFTNYLSKVSKDWKDRIGEGNTVQWPVGLGGKGDAGVTAFVQRLPGAIGYVDYAYAQSQKLAYTLLQNKSGAFVAPDAASIRAAAISGSWEKSSFATYLTDAEGKDAWPLAGATFILMRKVQDKAVQGKEIVKFFEWSFQNGAGMVGEAHYVALPESVLGAVSATWTHLSDSTGKPLIE